MRVALMAIIDSATNKNIALAAGPKSSPQLCKNRGIKYW